MLVCLTVANTHLLWLAIYSCRSGDLQVIYLIVVVRHPTYHHRVFIWTRVCMLSSSCLDSHWDLQVSVEPLNSGHHGVCCCDAARLTCIFTFWRITALITTLILSKVERWSKIAKMVLAIRTILDLVDVDLSKGLRTVFKVVATSSRTGHEMGLFGQCATVLSDIEFLHWFWFITLARLAKNYFLRWFAKAK